jgi:hypothetical protein
MGFVNYGDVASWLKVLSLKLQFLNENMLLLDTAMLTKSLVHNTGARHQDPRRYGEHGYPERGSRPHSLNAQIGYGGVVTVGAGPSRDGR